MFCYCSKLSTFFFFQNGDSPASHQVMHTASFIKTKHMDDCMYLKPNRAEWIERSTFGWEKTARTSCTLDMKIISLHQIFIESLEKWHTEALGNFKRLIFDYIKSGEK
jgi:hypothetical protein